MISIAIISLQTSDLVFRARAFCSVPLKGNCVIQLTLYLSLNVLGAIIENTRVKYGNPIVLFFNCPQGEHCSEKRFVIGYIHNTPHGDAREDATRRDEYQLRLFNQ